MKTPLNASGAFNFILACSAAVCVFTKKKKMKENERKKNGFSRSSGFI
ncbi:hypothetical protein, unlikely [Trypanosoma brucei brucei TREU927]|uniref:Lipoprotein n=1 Tax=Trypanosoma brucei brucei (strain 927/4 GUTat10.1) TaxID=185431 RepID=Q38FC2_TRYB2|nr:hypothetical protein, unlikely [Trypanosoma brucei brucei TREU927]EAN76498.1 hypothetical protein, unlikely [Trypanosoma brucei brucei TREU927]